jgi:hypothetical protein
MTSAFRVHDQALAHVLVQETPFPRFFRRDPLAKCWRRLERAEVTWQRVTDLREVLAAARDHLDEVLRDELPFALRALDRRAAVDAAWVFTLAELDAFASWSEADSYLRALDPAQRARRAWPADSPCPIASLKPHREQAERLRRRLSGRLLREVIEEAGVAPACRYMAPAAPVFVDPRAWIETHTRRSPDGRLRTSTLHAAYVAAVAAAAPQVAPMHPRLFRAVAEAHLGRARHLERGDVYMGWVFEEYAAADVEASPDRAPADATG